MKLSYKTIGIVFKPFNFLNFKKSKLKNFFLYSNIKFLKVDRLRHCTRFNFLSGDLLIASFKQLFENPKNLLFDVNKKQNFIGLFSFPFFQKLSCTIENYLCRREKKYCLGWSSIELLIIQQALKQKIALNFSEKTSLQEFQLNVSLQKLTKKIKSVSQKTSWILRYSCVLLVSGPKQKLLLKVLKPKRFKNKEFVFFFLYFFEKLTKQKLLDDGYFLKLINVLVLKDLDNWSFYFCQELNYIFKKKIRNVTEKEISILLTKALRVIPINIRLNLLLGQLKKNFYVAKQNFLKKVVWYFRYESQVLVGVQHSKVLINFFQKQLKYFFSCCCCLSFKKSSVIFFGSFEVFGFLFKKSVTKKQSFVKNFMKKNILRYQKFLTKQERFFQLAFLTCVAFNFFQKGFQIKTKKFSQKLFLIERLTISNFFFQKHSRGILKIKIFVPLRKIKNQLIFSGLLNKKLKPCSLNRLLLFYADEILNWYHFFAFSIFKYYKNCINFEALTNYLKYTLKWSFFHTVAKKNKKKLLSVLIKYSKKARGLFQKRFMLNVPFFDLQRINNKRFGLKILSKKHFFKARYVYSCLCGNII